MRSYEALIAYHPDTSEGAVKDQLERVKQIVAGQGGEVTQVVDWGIRDLAYRIRKQRRAYYAVVEFKGTGTVVSELERNLRISEQVLRYMTTRVDPNRPPLENPRVRRDVAGEGGEFDVVDETGGEMQDDEGPDSESSELS
jgi:small subunit ribosomal protein S6